MSAGLGSTSAAGVRLGILQSDSDAITALVSLVFCLGCAVLHALLYRSRIVPRQIAAWGLAAIPYAAPYLFAM